MMRISERGLDLIKRFEGLKLTAYQDSAGVWTIGYGHTKGARAGMTITEAQADELLRQDVREAEDAVDRLVTVPLSQPQFDALVSWTFNLGSGSLAESTMLKRINAGLYSAVPEEMQRWVYAGGEKLKGLERRRKAEADLFDSGHAPQPQAQDAPKPQTEENDMLKWVLDRAKERSTWVGLISLVTAAGVALGPDQKEAIIAVGVALAGAVATFTKDKLPKE